MFRFCIPQTTSPINSILELLPEAISNVAPELINELNGIRETICVEVLDDSRWIFCASSNEKRIQLSTCAVEVLWAQSYAVYIYYKSVVAGKKFDGTRIPINDPHVKSALTLYEWALNQFSDNAVREDWPTSLPRPEKSPPLDSDSSMAQELCLFGLGSILLHELAHILLHHHRSADLIDQERDADKWMNEWLFTRGSPAEDQIWKRAIGLAVTLSLPVSRGMYTGDFNGITHPRDFDRVYNALDNISSPKSEDAWGLIVAVLSLHYANIDQVVPHGPFKDFKEATNAFIDHLADLYEGRQY
jgi:hypothetical protein